MTQPLQGSHAASGGDMEEVLNISTFAMEMQITFSRSMLVVWAEALKQLKPDTTPQVVTIREIAIAEALVKKRFITRHMCPACNRYFDDQYIVSRDIAFCTWESRAAEMLEPPSLDTE